MARFLLYAAFFCALPLAAAPPPFSMFTRTDLRAAGAVDVVSADFNGDGIPDIAVLGAVDVQVFLGTGNRGFRLASTTPLPGYPNGYIKLVVADFNLDGKLDLAGFGGTGFILLGNGDGTFTMGVTLASTSFPAVTADFNGDGKPDLAVSYLSDSTFSIAILLGNGDGTFGPPYVISGSVPDCLEAGDMNGDGKADLVTCELVYPGNGNGTFAAPIPFTLPSQAAFAKLGDLNGDGKLDLVAIKAYGNGVPSGLGPVYVLYGNGDGTFQEPAVQVHSDVGTLLPSVAIGDLNGDGLPDIAVLGGGGLVGILTNNGNGGFNRAQVETVTYASGLPWASVTLADLSSDRHLDIIAAGNSDSCFSILFHSEAGGFRNVSNVSILNEGPAGTVDNATPVAEADFNGDGLPDIAFVADGNGAIFIDTYFRTGDPSEPLRHGPQTNITIPAGNSLVGGIAVADFNNDGKMDLAICFIGINGVNTPGTVQVYLGNGDGTFTLAPGTLNLALTAFQMVAADFNGDGKPDLAFSSGYVALGNGDGTFGAPIPVFPSNGNYFAVWLGAADFNHDGKVDLAFQICQGCEFTPPLLIFLGNGDGTFQPPASYTWNGLAQWAAIADVNHDGNPDIIALNSQLGPDQPIAAVFLGSGDGTFQSPSYVYDIWASQPNQVIVTDMNGDGNPDLVISDWRANSVYLFAGNGDGTFGQQVQVGAAAGIGWLGAMDLQGQTVPGFPDLLMVDFLQNGFYPVNHTAFAVSILYNDGWR